MKILFFLVSFLTCFLNFTAHAGNPDLFYFVSDGNNRLYSINRTTGAVVNIGALGVSRVEAIAYYPIPGADAGDWGTINRTTGAFTTIGQIDNGRTANGSEVARTLDDLDGVVFKYTYK